MRYDQAATRDLVCPLCKVKGTLRPISPRRRMVAGPWSFVRLLSKTHECTGCGAVFTTQQLVDWQRAA